jgi:hypothetical protein
MISGVRELDVKSVGRYSGVRFKLQLDAQSHAHATTHLKKEKEEKRWWSATPGPVKGRGPTSVKL